MPVRFLLLAAALSISCFAGTYSNDFSSVGFGKFEEPINACYATNAGSVALAGGALEIRANMGLIPYSNHVIAQHLIASNGVGGIVTYDLDFYIDADENDNLSYPQTGPEFSIQNTRLIAGVYRTQTMALQYVANPWASGWNVWSGAAWVATYGPTLTPRTWYHATLVADMDASVYVSANVGEFYFPVEGVSIAREAKWNESAFWVTVEAENLWANACGGSGDYILSARVLYDNVSVGW